MIEVYTQSKCNYCNLAKGLLRTRELPFTEIVIGEDISREEIRSRFPGMKTAPIIVVDGRLVGGYTQLMEEMSSNPGFGKTLLLE